MGASSPNGGPARPGTGGPRGVGILCGSFVGLGLGAIFGFPVSH